MISKIHSVSSVRATLKYIKERDQVWNVGGDSPTIISDSELIFKQHLMTDDVDRVCRNMKSVSDLRSLKDPGMHFILSLDPKDDFLENEDFGSMCKEYLEEMGYKDCQALAYRHFDTDLQHVHILVNRVACRGEQRGKTVSSQMDQRKSMRISRGLESKHELTPLVKGMTGEKTRDVDHYTKKRGGVSHRDFARNEIRRALVGAKSIDELFDNLKNNSIVAPAKIDKDGEIVGVTYKCKGPTGKTRTFKGSVLGEDFTLYGIDQRLSQNRSTEKKSEMSIYHADFVTMMHGRSQLNEGLEIIFRLIKKEGNTRQEALGVIREAAKDPVFSADISQGMSVWVASQLMRSKDFNEDDTPVARVQKKKSNDLNT
jgi:hypothetical protein